MSSSWLGSTRGSCTRGCVVGGVVSIAAGAVVSDRDSVACVSVGEVVGMEVLMVSGNSVSLEVVFSAGLEDSVKQHAADETKNDVEMFSIAELDRLLAEMEESRICTDYPQILTASAEEGEHFRMKNGSD